MARSPSNIVLIKGESGVCVTDPDLMDTFICEARNNTCPRA